MADFDLNTGPNLPDKTDYGIGCIGAGFIMRDIHLPAYNEAGFNARRDRLADARARRARPPSRTGCAKVYDTWQELLDDPRRRDRRHRLSRPTSSSRSSARRRAGRT